MADYVRAAMGFGHMYFSLWIGLWMETEEDEERIGRFICSWFAVLFCRYGVSKLVGDGDADCLHAAAMYYWFALLFRTLWQKAYWLHSRFATDAWVATALISIYSLRLNYLMSRDYDKYNAALLWSNNETVDDRYGVFDHMSYIFLMTPFLLTPPNEILLFLWTIMVIDLVWTYRPNRLVEQLVE